MMVGGGTGRASVPGTGLEKDHTREAIATRLVAAAEHSYLGDFILGAIDGAVTTFAVVAAAAGAGLSSSIAIMLGLANILADGFSMGVSNYSRAKADQQIVDRARRIEEEHIQMVPHGEREEVRQIFAAKGFEGEVLEEIVSGITQDRQQWVDMMLTEELGLRLETPVPVRAGLTTFTAFVMAGIIPLFPLLFSSFMTPAMTYGASAASTGAAFFLIGLIKGWRIKKPWIVSGLETLGVGGAAALLAFLVGSLSKGFLGE